MAKIVLKLAEKTSHLIDFKAIMSARIGAVSGQFRGKNAVFQKLTNYKSMLYVVKNAPKSSILILATPKALVIRQELFVYLNLNY